MSARNASYWLAVASTTSSSRVNAAATDPSTLSSSSSACRSHGTSLLWTRPRATFLDPGTTTTTTSTTMMRSFLELRSQTIVPQEEGSGGHGSDVAGGGLASLYDSDLFVPTRLGLTVAATRAQGPAAAGAYYGIGPRPTRCSPTRRERKRPVVRAEEVFEYQRYQRVLGGWGAKGHLLPLDPDKYMRVVRHTMPRPQEHDEDEDEQVLLEWSPSSTFPDIVLPPAPATATPRGRNYYSKQRSRSATSGSDALVDARGSAAFVSERPHAAPRWEWVSPWHLEVPVDTPSDAVDGWQYASSFSHFVPRPSHRTRGRSIDSLSQLPTYSGGAIPSSSPASSSGKRLRVRRRKWVRYRRLRSARSGICSSAFDDAFLDSMSGWLRKRGHVRKNWKARYFVLEKSVLRYYTDSSRTKLKGEVLLFHPQTRVHYLDVHVAGGRDASFAIQVGPEYTLLLQAAQLRDRENWMYCIEDALLCRDSYHPQGMTTGGPGPFFDLRESVAHRRLLSAEAMALDGRSFRDNLGGISHAHGDAASYELSDEEGLDDESEPSLHGQRRSDYGGRGSNGSDVLRLWASLHAKPGGVLSAVSSASRTMRFLLRACDQFLSGSAMRQHIASFLIMFRQKYEHLSASTVTTMGASAWTRLSEPWAPVGVCGNESDSDPELRDGSIGETPEEMYNVTTLQDARSLLALKNYRFFLERSLELIMDHLSSVVNPSIPQEHGHAALNKKRDPTDDEWALARRAALYKLERRTFIPLQEIIYQLLGAGVGPGQRQEEEERFERSRALVSAQPQSFLEIQPSHQSPSEWKSVVALFDSMDNYSLPSEKAAVLVETARCICETHAREHGYKADSASSSKQQQQQQSTLMAADDFLPIFIFVLARCHLRSVIVTRHLISETMITALMIGETGYYATMLEAAIGYIAAFDGAAKTGKMVHRDSSVA